MCNVNTHFSYKLLQAYDPNSLETCKAFLDAKRKLRLVLSTADIHTLPMMVASLSLDYPASRQHDLLAVLKMQLAEAINLQDKDLVAQLHETIRCLQQFSPDGYVIVGQLAVLSQFCLL